VEIFRLRQDVYGQNVLEGLNWDLIWVFLAIGGAVIVIHLMVKALSRKSRN